MSRYNGERFSLKMTRLKILYIIIVSIKTRTSFWRACLSAKNGVTNNGDDVCANLR